MSRIRGKLSTISRIHYIKLVVRSLLFLAALAVYVVNRLENSPSMFGGYEDSQLLLLVLTAFFSVEMVLRCFPSKYESMGCQKQFARNYIPGDESFDRRELRRRSVVPVLTVLLSWIVLNGLIALLYFLGYIDWGILLLIAIAYSVCDMICILFFCPFQTWMMKNRCCQTCRIYNWDYAMMFTPLMFVNNIYAHILVGLSLVLLLRWELCFFLHPERFYEQSNLNLSCAACREKLCHHKKQLMNLRLRKNWNSN